MSKYITAHGHAKEESSISMKESFTLLRFQEQETPSTKEKIVLQNKIQEFEGFFYVFFF